MAQADRELLTLEPAKRKDNSTGFEGVSPSTHPTSGVVSFSCKLPGETRGGKRINVRIGTYTTAAEAALSLARAKVRARAAEV